MKHAKRPLLGLNIVQGQTSLANSYSFIWIHLESYLKVSQKKWNKVAKPSPYGWNSNKYWAIFKPLKLGFMMSNRGSKKEENHQNLTLTLNQVQLWRPTHTRALFLPQKSPNEAKKRVSNAAPIFFPRSNERVFIIPKIQISIINCKIKSILSGLVTGRLYF